MSKVLRLHPRRSSYAGDSNSASYHAGNTAPAIYICVTTHACRSSPGARCTFRTCLLWTSSLVRRFCPVYDSLRGHALT